ncbi:hypothetical protein [Pseudomonas chlororaphis]|uniref:hypothetical protein n=1 Tax=Pseudomonas chlororaphis TaxID=587753 RepID=UPI0015DF81B7|nr:hypothetical protein [Pseudomonas chlororaphis]QLL13455.1 hypothetical protein H0I86_31615 [Pseudomonas chlororaphis subsp. aurantiaca]
MNETIDPRYAAAVFNRQRASFKATMQQFHALHREIDLLMGKAHSDPEARRKVANVEQDIRRSGAERERTMRQILKAENAFSKLEGDFSKRFPVEVSASSGQVAVKNTAMKKHRVFA